MKHIYLFLSLIIVLLSAGCAQEDVASVDIDSGKVVELELLMPIPSSLVTRSIENNLDKMVVEPLVLFFDKDEKLLAFSKAKQRSEVKYWLPINSNLTSKITKVVVVANYNPKQVESLVLGESRSDIGKRFIFSSPLDLSNGIPMLGEVNYAEGAKDLTIKMRRSVASIDVTLNESLQNVNIRKLHLSNYTATGYFGAFTAGSTTNKVTSFDVVNNSSINEVFISDVSQSNMDKEPTVVVAEVEKGGRTLFYRIDFVEKNNSGTMEYLRIRKNYKYQFMINEIVGDGWRTLNEAISNKLTYSLEYDLITWEEGVESMWEYDGKYLGLRNSVIPYNDMTSVTTPERIEMQTNMNTKELIFTSDYFLCKISNGNDGSDTGYLDFYPKVRVSAIPEKASGVISTADGKYKRTITFKKNRDFLEIYGIESELYGKYVQGVPLKASENYIDLSLAYRAKIQHTFRVDNLPSSTDPGVKLSGTIEFDPNKSEVLAKIYFTGTPSKTGNVDFKIDFGAVHPQSPVQGLNLSYRVSESGNYRPTKILVITKKGGDVANYGDLFTAERLASLSTGKTHVDQVDVVFASTFPLDSYQDYHIIFYFDSTNILSDNASLNRSNQLKVFKALSNHYNNSGGVIYCSDRVYESGYQSAALEATKLFFQELGIENTNFYNWNLAYDVTSILSDKRFEKYAYLQENTNNAGKETLTFEYGKYSSGDTSLNVLVGDFTPAGSGVRRIFSAYKDKTFYGIIGEDYKNNNFMWMGTSALFINIFKDTRTLTLPAQTFLRKVGLMVQNVDAYQYFNKANKVKQIYDNPNGQGFTINFSWNKI